jgi:hypothetical protein
VFPSKRKIAGRLVFNLSQLVRDEHDDNLALTGRRCASCRSPAPSAARPTPSRRPASRPAPRSRRS